MGYILYRDRTKPSETDKEMWNSPLNSYLREQHMGHAGAICTLPDMIRHVEAIGSLWWNYTDSAPATLGIIQFVSGGHTAPVVSPLIDNPELFTAAAVEGLRAWHELLTADQHRRTLYGHDHADLLLSRFRLGEHYADQDSAHCRFIDGTLRDVPATTVVATLAIDRAPIYTPADYFNRGTHSDRQTRVSTTDYLDQAAAIQQGWKDAASHTTT
ncbi:hypothetical protein ACFWGI_36610 [Streptomyces niveus]|uniref:hypothetical protein n=1 Tax=Streptomyces niveus TaxID=193462 RepID=UPI003646B4ED